MEIQRFDQLPVSAGLIHSLPFPSIKSRLCTAYIWTHFDIRKRAVAVLIKLSRSSRAFIITQQGLPGFLLSHFDNIQSFEFFAIGMPAQFRAEFEMKETANKLGNLASDLEAC